jgi:phosphohistidine phosphatase
MKTLLLMRHAKAAEGDGQMRDWERPLAPRGLEDAPRMGRAIRERGIVPDVILSSSAVRTRQTTELVVEAAGFETEPQYLDDLYGADVETMTDILRELPEDCDCALVIGHNPTVTEMVMMLGGIGNADMPTGAVACLEYVPGEWSMTDNDCASLKWLLTPKKLAEKL